MLYNLVSLSIFDLFLDAVNAILTFSQSVEELLKRKKIKRDTLFRYLASHGIGIDPKGEKHTLVDEILKFWKEQEVGDSNQTFCNHIAFIAPTSDNM